MTQPKRGLYTVELSEEVKRRCPEQGHGDLHYTFVRGRFHIEQVASDHNGVPIGREDALTVVVTAVSIGNLGELYQRVTPYAGTQLERDVTGTLAAGSLSVKVDVRCRIIK